MAASLLDQIESGADVEPILLQLKSACPTRDTREAGSVRDVPVTRVKELPPVTRVHPPRDKMVTFQENLSVQNI